MYSGLNYEKTIYLEVLNSLLLPKTTRQKLNYEVFKIGYTLYLWEMYISQRIIFVEKYSNLICFPRKEKC